MSNASDDPFFPVSEGSVVRAEALRLPGVAHAFGTRVAGVDQLGSRVGFDPARLARVQQVHGDRVVVVAAATDPRQLAAEQADALVTAEAGCFVAVQTADCVPVLLCDPRRRVVAAAHAGWRGLVGGVLERTVETMASRFGCGADELRAAVGPCIGGCCYEVSPEVAARFERWPSAVISRPEGRPHVELRAAARAILAALGLPAAGISVTRLATCCRPELFFSYRCQGPETGRQLSVIGLP